MTARVKSKLYLLFIVIALAAVSAVIVHSSNGEDTVKNDMSIPPIDLMVPEVTETATFALG